jgi:hypothetical protein
MPFFKSATYAVKVNTLEPKRKSTYQKVSKPSLAMVSKEMKEHPWISQRNAIRLVKDHLRMERKK